MVIVDGKPRLSKSSLKKAKLADVIRLAQWLGLKHIDGMSQRQLASLIVWLITRRDKRSRGLTLW